MSDSKPKKIEWSREVVERILMGHLVATGEAEPGDSINIYMTNCFDGVEISIDPKD